MVARTVLDNFRVVGDNSDDIKAVFQVVLRLSQDVGECYSRIIVVNLITVQNQSVSLIMSIKGDSSESSPITESVRIVDQPSVFFFKDLKNVKV